MNRRSVFFGAVLALALFAVALSTGRTRGEGPPLDPDSTGPLGTRALVELLGELDIAVTRGLPDGDSGTALVLTGHLDNVRAAREPAAQALEIARQAERLSASHIQHVGLLRYNPFSHTGGDQSFVLALADHDGNGAVVNGLHAREGTRIYAKPLVGWESIYTLTEDEREAIGKARGLPVAVPNHNGKVAHHV